MGCENREEIGGFTLTVVRGYERVGGRIVGHFIDTVRTASIDRLDLAVIEVHNLEGAVTVTPNNLVGTDDRDTDRPRAARRSRADEGVLSGGILAGRCNDLRQTFRPRRRCGRQSQTDRNPGRSS